MNRIRIALVLLLGSAWLGAAGPHGLAAQPAPLGPEVLVSTGDNHFLFSLRLAVQPGGDSEIAWESEGPDLSKELVLARHFAADGTPTDAAQVIGQGTLPLIDSVTAEPTGFDVLWLDQRARKDFHYRRHLGLNGVPDAKPVRLGGIRYLTPWVWQVRGNGFLAGWLLWPVGSEPKGMVARRLSSSGRLTGPLLSLASRPFFTNERPSLLAVADGGFLAVWCGITVGFPDVPVVRARRFSPAAQALGPDFDLNTSFPASEACLGAKVAAAPGGGFAVAWLLDGGNDETFTPYLRLFDAAGNPLGPEVPGAATEWIESMAFDEAGNLLVLWGERKGFRVSDFELQLLDPHGLPLGPRESVGSAVSDPYQDSLEGAVAWSGSSWIVTWAAQTTTFPESSAVFVRRFAGH